MAPQRYSDDLSEGLSRRPAEGLTRRALTYAGGAFDRNLPAADQWRRRGAVGVAGGGAITGAVLGLEALGQIDPAVLHTVGALSAMGGYGAAAGAAVTGAMSIWGGISVDCEYTSSGKLAYRQTTHNVLRHTRTAAVIATGVLAAAAAGIEGGTLLGLHNAALVSGLADAASGTAGAALATHIGSRLWAIGLPKPEPPARPAPTARGGRPAVDLTER